MDFQMEEALVLLARFPGTLDALLRGLPECWTTQNEGENTMTVFDVVGHLTHLERTDWLPRARIILQAGEARPFEAVDRWAHLKESQGKTLEELLDEFARLRAVNLAEVRGWQLTAEDLARSGRHPALGSVTLSELLATWTDHDLTHLHQIARVMAHQYRDAVGPWSEYLGVLRCRGSAG